MIAGTGLGMKPHRKLRLHRLDVADLEQKVALPGLAIVLAVGDDLEPDLFLQAHDAADRIVLDADQVGRRKLARIGRGPRFDQRVRPDQAADMVGAEWWHGSLPHG